MFSNESRDAPRGLHDNGASSIPNPDLDRILVSNHTHRATTRALHSHKVSLCNKVYDYLVGNMYRNSGGIGSSGKLAVDGFKNLPDRSPCSQKINNNDE